MWKAQAHTLFERYVLTKEVKLDSARFLEVLEEVRLAPIAPKIFVRESEEPLPGSYLIIVGNYRAVAHACIGRPLRLLPIRTSREVDILLKDDTAHKPLPFRESVVAAARTKREAILDEALLSAARRLNFRTAHDLAIEHHSLVDSKPALALDTGPIRTFHGETRKFVEIFPWMENDSRKIEVPFLSIRLAKCLRENHVVRWSELGSLTPADLYAWDRIGHKSVSLLLKFLETQAYQLPIELFSGRNLGSTNGLSLNKATRIFAESDQGSATAQSPGVSQSAILTLSRYATFFSNSKTLGHILDSPEKELPHEVAHAVRQLRELDLTSVIADRDSITDLGSLFNAFFNEFTKHEMDIFFERLSPGRRTLHSIGVQMNLTRERVRQLEAATLERIEQLLDSQKYMPIRWASQIIRARIGTAFSEKSSQWRDVILDGISGWPGVGNERIQKLILFIAGPYEFDSETQWYFAHPIPNARLYESCMNRFGVVNTQKLMDIITAYGIRSEFVPAWMIEVAKLKEIDGSFVQWEGSVADKAVSVLDVAGGSRPIGNVVEVVNGGHNLRYTQQCLYADPRIVRMENGEIGLRFRDTKRAGRK